MKPQMTLKGVEGEDTRRHREWLDARPVVTRCFLPPCRGGVLHAGPAAEGREAAERHRKERHPDVEVVRRRRTPEQQRAIAMAKSDWKRRRWKGEE